jgi:hypothetical protein
MNDTPKDQQLDEAYRRASAAGAGRPREATRAAILAEAKAAARKRAPAANDARYLLRAVAGVAVVGVAILIWRQTDAPLPGELVETAPVSAPQSADAAAEPQFVPDLNDLPTAQTEPSQPQEPPAQLARERREQGVAEELRDVTRPAPSAPRIAEAPLVQAPLAEQAAVAPPPAVATEDSQAKVAGAGADGAVSAVERDELEEVQVTGSRVVTPPRVVGPRGGVAGATESARSRQVAPYDARSVLERHFPDEFASNQQHRLWVVLAADATMIDSGEIEPNESADAALSYVKSRLGLTDAGAWRTHRLTNARGQRIELSVIRSP